MGAGEKGTDLNRGRYFRRALSLSFFHTFHRLHASSRSASLGLRSMWPCRSAGWSERRCGPRPWRRHRIAGPTVRRSRTAFAGMADRQFGHVVVDAAVRHQRSGCAAQVVQAESTAKEANPGRHELTVRGACYRMNERPGRPAQRSTRADWCEPLEAAQHDRNPLTRKSVGRRAMRQAVRPRFKWPWLILRLRSLDTTQTPTGSRRIDIGVSAHKGCWHSLSPSVAISASRALVYRADCWLQGRLRQSSIARSRPSTPTWLPANWNMSPSVAAPSVCGKCLPTPTSTSSLPTRPERILHRVRLQRPALAILALRLPNQWLSRFRIDQMHDPAGSGGSRATGAREGEAARRADQGGTRVAAARRRIRSLLAWDRPIPCRVP